jgi:23S rRNA (cytosine1962-C5)-methyltransferase
LIARAVKRRAPLGARGDLNAYRLLHGVGDSVPGLSVDRYGQLLVIHADSAPLLEEWVAQLRAHLEESFAAAYVKLHPRRTGCVRPDLVKRLAPEEPLWGKPVESATVQEYGVRYLIRPAAGLSVGLFLDMREVRQYLRSSVSGRSVLNLFAYTCAFGVCATLGGGSRVVNLDLSRPHLEWGKANYELNGCAVDGRDFIYGDAFDWLVRFVRRSWRFDLVIIDPPSFSSTPFSVTRDYPGLVAAASRVVSPGGTLLAATNHAATSDERFEGWLGRGLADGGRRGRLLYRWHEPSPDFPLPPGGRPYLKVRALELD